jgi:hypothetical protein
VEILLSKELIFSAIVFKALPRVSVALIKVEVLE